MLCEGFHSVFVTLAEASHMSTPVTAGQDALVWREKEYVERTVTLPKDPFCKDTRLGYRKYTRGGRLEQTEEKGRFFSNLAHPTTSDVHSILKEPRETA